VRGLRLDDEERTAGFEQPVDLAQRLDRRREIVDAVANGNEVESPAGLLRAESDLQLLRRLAGAGDGLRVHVVACDLRRRESFLDGDRDAPRTAAVVEDPAAGA